MWVNMTVADWMSPVSNGGKGRRKEIECVTCSRSIESGKWSEWEEAEQIEERLS